MSQFFPRISRKCDSKSPLLLAMARRAVIARLSNADFSAGRACCLTLFIEGRHATLEVHRADVPQVCFACKSQQLLRFLHVVHRLLGGFRITLCRVGFRVLKLHSRAVELRIVDFFRNGLDARFHFFRVVLNQFRGVGVIDLSVLARIEIAAAVEVGADGRDHDIEHDRSGVMCLVVDEQLRAFDDNAVREIGAPYFEKPYEAVVRGGSSIGAFEQRELDRTRSSGVVATRPRGT